MAVNMLSSSSLPLTNSGGVPNTINNTSDAFEATPSLPYFEHAWSVLSIICVFNVFLGLLIIGITSFSKLTAVPIISSAAGAIANGLYFYAYYDKPYPLAKRAAASAIGDIFWLIQEAGMPFYSFIILNRLLRGKKRKFFHTVFWSALILVTAVKVMVIYYRLLCILREDNSLSGIIIRIHIAYFGLIAVSECVSAYFLLRIFAEVRKSSNEAGLRTSFMRYLMRSTEIRVASLAVAAAIRVVTHSLNVWQSSSATRYLDRVAYALECFFPIIMYVDLLASKLEFTTQTNDPSFASNRRLRGPTSTEKTAD
ncbi:hypothetical protein CORC01_06811 [Colletotrichum orchidophilum]|uniref:Integral membrane protein n=1 Tax=Colletotrichum orchidophilum TaxID=1209926 RepID=A0A1G4B947_9PEZI|nr:uncharacterized protein CORC01_06811 [Colletotrichum orchidophilum]OHE97948.1 hypothetical protein CORC01_06811 [Colletotrichum orchidophilum]